MLVVIVVFLFLGNLRATIIPAVAVPVSLIGAFAVLLALGYSANTVSLLAMVLAIGIVVDDAIVVVENVERVMEEEPELSPREAAKKAMTQITAPIIAISLVLLSVFVPIAFIPGISGKLFRQFAVTISAAMVISALNALTLSPALCAVFLRPHARRERGIMGRVLGGIDRVRDGYAAVVHAAAAGGGAVGCAGRGVRRWRLRHVAADADRLPAGGGPGRVLHRGAAARRRLGGAHREVASRSRASLSKMPGIQHVLSIIGFSLLDGGAEPNAAFMVARLKPFADRTSATESVQALIGRTFGAPQQIRSANVFPFNLPPIIGLSTSGGFEYQLEALEGQDPAAIGSVMQGLIAAANQDPRLTRVFSTFTATNPSIYLDIDRAKAQALGAQHQRRVHRAAGDARRHLRQQLQSVRPHLAGQRPGRGRRPPRHSDIWQIYVRNSDRPDGADALDRRRCGS